MRKNGFARLSKNHVASKVAAGASFKKPLNDSVQKKHFFVVGVGASAGGLEAFSELLRGIPKDSRMAFVLIQHLSPSHPSLLTELISRSTSLKVSEVVNKTAVEPGNIYVIPPNTEMVISSGILLLTQRKIAAGRNTAIDVFFRSLAEDQKECAIGIVLSGSESDGVLGLESIKAEGGITFAQDETTAKYKDMPRKAAASGVVDFILTPKEIAAYLSDLPSKLSSLHFKSPQKSDLSPKDDKALSKVIEFLRSKTGMDFHLYKSATILRRITRRMIMQKISDLDAYFKYLRRDKNEVHALRKDLLINVTSFFRDPETFDLLKKKILPEILKRREKGMPLRVWVPGCSTGNEAYSIAICLNEFLKDQPGLVQIFATDVSDGAVESARRGAYPESIKLDVSDERLERYFHKSEGGYQINKAIRDMCVFAVHNMLTDPPFSDIDLISCRNVLIYLEPQLQKKVMSHFLYSLKPNGFLMLGGSETLGESADHFYTVDKKKRVFAKVGVPKQRQRLNFEQSRLQTSLRTTQDRRKMPRIANFDVRTEATKLMAKKECNDGVLIAENMEIIEFYGVTEPFLRHEPGRASFNLLQMVRQKTLPDLCIAVFRAKKEGRPVRTSLSARL